MWLLTKTKAYHAVTLYQIKWYINVLLHACSLVTRVDCALQQCILSEVEKNLFLRASMSTLTQ
jgi:hypothetical protein